MKSKFEISAIANSTRFAVSGYTQKYNQNNVFDAINLDDKMEEFREK